jgi:hypothetical protein
MAHATQYEVQAGATAKLNEWIEGMVTVHDSVHSMVRKTWGAHYLGSAACRSRITGSFTPYDAQLIEIAPSPGVNLRFFDFPAVEGAELPDVVGNYATSRGVFTGHLTAPKTFSASRLYARHEAEGETDGGGSNLWLGAVNPSSGDKQAVRGLIIRENEIARVNFAVVEGVQR